VYRLLAPFQKDQSGATAIEYGLIAAGIAGLWDQWHDQASGVSSALK
jgi:hypothetical protein